MWLLEKRIGGPAGFTLLELAIVVGIVGSLASIAIPSYFNYVKKAKEFRAIADIRTLEKEILVYREANDCFPLSLDDIKRGGLQDPWGNPYQYLNLADAGEKEKDKGKDEDKGEETDKGKPRKDHFMVPLLITTLTFTVWDRTAIARLPLQHRRAMMTSSAHTMDSMWALWKSSVRRRLRVLRSEMRVP